MTLLIEIKNERLFYSELEITDELHIETGHCDTRREGVNAYSNNIRTKIVAKHEILYQNKIANEHNKFFARIDPKLTSSTLTLTIRLNKSN